MALQSSQRLTSYVTGRVRLFLVLSLAYAHALFALALLGQNVWAVLLLLLFALFAVRYTIPQWSTVEAPDVVGSQGPLRPALSGRNRELLSAAASMAYGAPASPPRQQDTALLECCAWEMGLFTEGKTLFFTPPAWLSLLTSVLSILQLLFTLVASLLLTLTHSLDTVAVASLGSDEAHSMGHRVGMAVLQSFGVWNWKKNWLQPSVTMACCAVLAAVSLYMHVTIRRRGWKVSQDPKRCFTRFSKIRLAALTCMAALLYPSYDFAPVFVLHSLAFLSFAISHRNFWRTRFVNTVAMIATVYGALLLAGSLFTQTPLGQVFYPASTTDTGSSSSSIEKLLVARSYSNAMLGNASDSTAFVGSPWSVMWRAPDWQMIFHNVNLAFKAAQLLVLLYSVLASRTIHGDWSLMTCNELCNHTEYQQEPPLSLWRLLPGRWCALLKRVQVTVGYYMPYLIIPLLLATSLGIMDLVSLVMIIMCLAGFVCSLHTFVALLPVFYVLLTILLTAVYVSLTATVLVKPLLVHYTYARPVSSLIVFAQSVASALLILAASGFHENPIMQWYKTAEEKKHHIRLALRHLQPRLDELRQIFMEECDPRTCVVGKGHFPKLVHRVSYTLDLTNADIDHLWTYLTSGDSILVQLTTEGWAADGGLTCLADAFPAPGPCTAARASVPAAGGRPVQAPQRLPSTTAVPPRSREVSPQRGVVESGFAFSEDGLSRDQRPRTPASTRSISATPVGGNEVPPRLAVCQTPTKSIPNDGLGYVEPSNTIASQHPPLLRHPSPPPQLPQQQQQQKHRECYVQSIRENRAPACMETPVPPGLSILSNENSSKDKRGQSPTSTTSAAFESSDGNTCHSARIKHGRSLGTQPKYVEAMDSSEAQSEDGGYKYLASPTTFGEPWPPAGHGPLQPSVLRRYWGPPNLTDAFNPVGTECGSREQRQASSREECDGGVSANLAAEKVKSAEETTSENLSQRNVNRTPQERSACHPSSLVRAVGSHSAGVSFFDFLVLVDGIENFRMENRGFLYVAASLAAQIALKNTSLVALLVMFVAATVSETLDVLNSVYLLLFLAFFVTRLYAMFYWRAVIMYTILHLLVILYYYSIIAAYKLDVGRSADILELIGVNSVTKPYKTVVYFALLFFAVVEKEVIRGESTWGVTKTVQMVEWRLFLHSRFFPRLLQKMLVSLAAIIFSSMATFESRNVLLTGFAFFFVIFLVMGVYSSKAQTGALVLLTAYSFCALIFCALCQFTNIRRSFLHELGTHSKCKGDMLVVCASQIGIGGSTSVGSTALLLPWFLLGATSIALCRIHFGELCGAAACDARARHRTVRSDPRHERYSRANRSAGHDVDTEAVEMTGMVNPLHPPSCTEAPRASSSRTPPNEVGCNSRPISFAINGEVIDPQHVGRMPASFVQVEEYPHILENTQRDAIGVRLFTSSYAEVESRVVGKTVRLAFDATRLLYRLLQFLQAVGEEHSGKLVWLALTFAALVTFSVWGLLFVALFALDRRGMSVIVVSIASSSVGYVYPFFFVKESPLSQEMNLFLGLNKTQSDTIAILTSLFACSAAVLHENTKKPDAVRRFERSVRREHEKVNPRERQYNAFVEPPECEGFGEEWQFDESRENPVEPQLSPTGATQRIPTLTSFSISAPRGATCLQRPDCSEASPTPSLAADLEVKTGDRRSGVRAEDSVRQPHARCERKRQPVHKLSTVKAQLQYTIRYLLHVLLVDCSYEITALAAVIGLSISTSYITGFVFYLHLTILWFMGRVRVTMEPAYVQVLQLITIAALGVLYIIRVGLPIEALEIDLFHPSKCEELEFYFGCQLPPSQLAVFFIIIMLQRVIRSNIGLVRMTIRSVQGCLELGELLVLREKDVEDCRTLRRTDIENVLPVLERNILRSPRSIFEFLISTVCLVLPAATLSFLQGVLMSSFLGVIQIVASLFLLSARRSLAWKWHVTWPKFVLLFMAMFIPQLTGQIPVIKAVKDDYRAIFELLGCAQWRSLTLGVQATVVWLAIVENRIFSEFFYAAYLVGLCQGSLTASQQHEEMLAFIRRNNKEMNLRAAQQEEEIREVLDRLYRERNINRKELHRSASSHSGTDTADESDSSSECLSCAPTRSKTTRSKSSPTRRLPKGIFHVALPQFHSPVLPIPDAPSRPAGGEASENRLGGPRKVGESRHETGGLASPSVTRSRPTMFDNSETLPPHTPHGHHQSGSGTLYADSSMVFDAENDGWEGVKKAKMAPITAAMADTRQYGESMRERKIHSAPQNNSGATSAASLQRLPRRSGGKVNRWVPKARELWKRLSRSLNSTLDRLIVFFSARSYSGREPPHNFSPMSRLLVAFFHFLIRRSSSFCFLAFMLNFAVGGTLLDMLLSLSGALYGMLVVPWAGKTYWRVALLFNVVSILGKCIVQVTVLHLGLQRKTLFGLSLAIVNMGLDLDRPSERAMMVDIVLDYVVFVAILAHRQMCYDFGVFGKDVNDAVLNRSPSKPPESPSVTTNAIDEAVDPIGADGHLCGPVASAPGDVDAEAEGPCPAVPSLTSPLVPHEQPLPQEREVAHPEAPPHATEDPATAPAKKPCPPLVLVTHHSCNPSAGVSEQDESAKAIRADGDAAVSFRDDVRGGLHANQVVPFRQSLQSGTYGSIFSSHIREELDITSKAKSCFTDLKERFAGFWANICGRHGAGEDYYTLQFWADSLSIIVFVAVYFILSGRESGNIFNSFQQDLLPGPFVVILIVLILIMSVERIVYVVHSIRLKFALHVVTAMFYHCAFVYWKISMATTTVTPAVVLLLVKLLSMTMSCFQIREGYPLHRKHDSFTTSTGVFHWIGATVYRTVPFLFELRMFLDWSATRTTLKLQQWTLLEVTHYALYRRYVDMREISRTSRTKGRPFPFMWKLYQGVFGFLVCIVVLFLPLLLYSTFNLNVGSNSIDYWNTELTFSHVGSFYEAETHLSPLESSFLDDLNDYRPNLHAEAFGDYAFLQKLDFPQCSATMWTASPEMKLQLLSQLDAAARDESVFEIFIRHNVRRTEAATSASKSVLLSYRKPVPHRAVVQLRDVLAAYNKLLNPSRLPPSTGSSADEPPPQLHFQSFTSGSVRLTASEWILLDDFHFPFARNEPKDVFLSESTPVPCAIQLNMAADPMTGLNVTYWCVRCEAALPVSLQSCPDPTSFRSRPAVGTPAGKSSTGCALKNDVRMQATAGAQRRGTGVGSGSDSSSSSANTANITTFVPLYSIVASADDTRDSAFSFLPNIGIIALYTTFVLALGTVIREVISGWAQDVVLRQVANPQPIAQLLRYIYIVRSSISNGNNENLYLEQQLFFEIVDLLRAPDRLVAITGLRVNDYDERGHYQKALEDASRHPF